MTDLNKPTETETTTDNTAANANQAAPEAEPPRGRCGWSREQCGWSREQWRQHGKCHGKRRWKVIGAAALIFFLGLMAGKASNHHHDHHGYRGEQATVVIPGEKPKPLSAILDSIQATPEQRAKAADLVY